MDKDIKVEDRVKVFGQEIYGIVVHVHPTEVVIEDEDADLFNDPEDKLFTFKKSEVYKISQRRLNTREKTQKIYLGFFLQEIKPEKKD